MAALRDVLDRQHGVLFCWAPVCLALGIAGYFSLKFEPVARDWALLGAVALAAAAAFAALGPSWRPLGWAVLLVAAGAGLAGLRAHGVAGPKLEFRYYGPVAGRVVAIDRSASDKLRLTLDQVTLFNLPPERTPLRVRVSLHGDQGFTQPQPGMRVMTTAHLSPPGGAVEPGGFDFRRHAWFQRLGGVGYTRVPLLVAAPPEEGRAGLAVFRLRMAISAAVQRALPGETGAFAAAITTGDRAGMGQESLAALRGSNLAHLLAISGLHMGLLAGGVYAAARHGAALIPALALRWPAQKVAAVIALIAGAGYLALSGGNVATERAFIMTAVALTAVLLDRRALTLRAVALAALIVLVLRPEALLGPGFQMSFAATTALVAVFGSLRGVELPRLPRWLAPVAGVAMSSAVAGLATAPVGAAHFNTIAHYGLIANLVSVPVMGALVMPAAIAAVLVAPLGLAWLPLWAMGLGLDWILAVAHWASSLPGASGHVVSPGPVVLPLIALGGITLILWQGRGRLAGAAMIAAGFAAWSMAARPAALVAEAGTLIGVMGPQGRSLSRAKGAGFVAGNWLQNDGDGSDQEAAAARPGFAPASGGVSAQIGDLRLRHVAGKSGREAFTGCAPGELVVFSVTKPEGLPCAALDPSDLQISGALAIHTGPRGVRIATARDVAGWRIWNTPRNEPRQLPKGLAMARSQTSPDG